MPGKYDPLAAYLSQIDSIKTTVDLTFPMIERILGDTLPASAGEHRAWWGNDNSANSHVQAAAWLGSGWEVSAVDFAAKSVSFRRR